MALYLSSHNPMSAVALLVGLVLLIQCCSVTTQETTGVSNRNNVELLEDFLVRTEHPLFVFYNRVPKTGSTTMLHVIDHAISKGRLTHYNSPRFRSMATTVDGLDHKVLLFVSILQKLTEVEAPLPLVFDEHFFYFNVTHHAQRVLEASCSHTHPKDDADFCDMTKISVSANFKPRHFRHRGGRSQAELPNLEASRLASNLTVREWLRILVKYESAVKYINVVRAPVSRVLSMYHYEMLNKRIPAVPLAEAMNSGWLSARELATYESVKSNISHILGAAKDPYANKRFNRLELWDQAFNFQVKFFCGHDLRCEDSGSQWALETALKNTRSAYVAIGVTEALDDLPAVLACNMPTVFGSLQPDTQKHNQSPRLPIEDWAIDRLESWNENDSKLYAALTELFREKNVEC